MSEDIPDEQLQAAFDDQRRKIISSVFSRRNAAGALDESYVAHLKIWDGGGPGAKPRYILLSQASSGSGYIHKSKLNQNDTFSVGKTWVLADLRGISVLSPSSFNIILQRSYQWDSVYPVQQVTFLDAIVKLFRTVTGGSSTLRLEGLAEPSLSASPSRQRVRSDYARSPSPTAAPSPSRRPNANRSNTPSQDQRDVEPPPARGQSRPPSPAMSSRGNIPSSRPSSRRPPSPAAQPRATHSRGASIAASARSPTPSLPQASRSNPSITSLSEVTRPVMPSSSPPRQRVASPEPAPAPVIPAPAPVSTRKPSRQTNNPPPEVVPQRDARRDPHARISFFDPANQAAIDRLLTAGSNELEGDDDNAQATMSNVEEMIEGYEWATDDIIGRKTLGGAADVIEARLLDELMALDRANIHSFLESDDRIGLVLKYMDDAIGELDNISTLISSYKIHLNSAGDDISYIQSQNRGLQVQTQNQRILMAELENLVKTVQVDKSVLLILTQESMEKESAIGRIEEAAADLYKALQAGRDTDMAATMERLQEYRTHNQQFCRRIFDFLSLRFTVQSQILLGNDSGLVTSKRGGRQVAIPHTEFENYLGRYAGLLIYLKEMDETVYGKLCATYFTAASDLHGTQMKALFSTYIGFVKKGAEEDQDGFTITPPTSAALKSPGAVRRAATVIRSPLERNKDRDKDKTDGDLAAPDALSLLLEQIGMLIYDEDAFVTTFLQVNDSSLTYADYMGLDNYFRRQASRGAGLSQTTMKLVRGAMDLIFGFLPMELKNWIDSALAKDKMQIFGVLVCIERFLLDAEDKGNEFLLNFLGKQHTRLKGLFDRHISEQIQNVEKTKLTSKKRNGVAPFIKFFPNYILRVESQLLGADGLEIRTTIDAAYERIVQSMFESLKQMAKMDGEGEDKGQLNYHVILIENMHHFVTELAELELGSVVSFLKKAEAIYDENVNSYVKIVLRRPFAKLIDYFEGVERLLKTTAPTEVAANPSYNKNMLKKVVKDFTVKDLRKHVDVLFKRVEKHFFEPSDKPPWEDPNGGTGADTVMNVWKACETELLRITEFFVKRISQCYPDGGVGLEYTAADVESSFKRHKIGA